MPETSVFLAFSRDFIILFFQIFCSKMRIRNVQNMTESDFCKKNFPAENAGNMSEIAVLTDFHRTFSLYFVVFSHKNIININAHHMHSSFVKKLIFVAGTFYKSPEQPIFAGKTVFLEFLELHSIFFHEIWHTDAK